MNRSLDQFFDESNEIYLQQLADEAHQAFLLDVQTRDMDEDTQLEELEAKDREETMRELMKWGLM